MSRFLLNHARPADDAALRGVMARTPMDGLIALSFRREPSFFDSTVVDGQFRQVIVGRDRTSHDVIVGLGSRSVRNVYVNGQAATVGYLSMLRILPDVRGRGILLKKGYEFLRALHNDERARIYLTTIAAGNARALSVLLGSRAGLPAYHVAGQYITRAIPIFRKRRPLDRDTSGLLSIAAATDRELSEVAEFLRLRGPARQFFPVYERDDFSGVTGVLRGLRPQDILLARRAGRIVATLAAWDQHAYRQTVVDHYRGALRLVRPAYNGWASLRGFPRLPRTGSSMRYVTAAIPVAAEGENDAFEFLLRVLLERLSGGEAEYFLFGLHEQDPLADILHRQRGTDYTTNLYHVCWEDGEDARSTLDARPPYLELGSL